MALTRVQRSQLRRVSAGTLRPDDIDSDEFEILLHSVTSFPAMLQEALEIIAGGRQIMLNRRTDLTDAEEMFLMEQGIAPEQHHLFRPYEGYPRILTFEEIEAQVHYMSGPREKLGDVLTSPSDLVFLTFLTAVSAE